MWKKEKIDNYRDYFRSQRINKTGNFTEFVVRTFYCIYKVCDNNQTNYCLEKDVEPPKIKYNIYGGVPDHDYYNVISDCFKYLCEMGYIQYETIHYKEIIVIKKQLDFLLENEHEVYLKKYGIKNDIDLNNEDIKLEKIQNKTNNKMNNKTNNKTDIKCTDCKNGYYFLREGPYNNFYGCSNFPKCRSTKSVADFIYTYLAEKGLNLYEEKINCWKCGKQISVFSYFLDLDLKLNNVAIPEFDCLEAVRLGMFRGIDIELSSKYHTLEERFSKKAGFSYIANICPYCNNLQGCQMGLGRVYDSLLEDLHNGVLESKIKENIAINKELLPKKTVQEMVKAVFPKNRGSIFDF